MVVVAVELTPLLVAVDRDVRGIDIEHDLAEPLRIHIQEEVHEQLAHRIRVCHDLLVAIPFDRLRAPQLHPIQRARPRQGIRPVTRPRPLVTRQVLAAHRQRERAVGAQPIMVGEILVAECQSHHALRDQIPDRMFRPRRVAVIGKALRGLVTSRTWFASRKSVTPASGVSRPPSNRPVTRRRPAS